MENLLSAHLRPAQNADPGQRAARDLDSSSSAKLAGVEDSFLYAFMNASGTAPADKRLSHDLNVDLSGELAQSAERANHSKTEAIRDALEAMDGINLGLVENTNGRQAILDPALESPTADSLDRSAGNLSWNLFQNQPGLRESVSEPVISNASFQRPGVEWSSTRGEWGSGEKEWNALNLDRTLTTAPRADEAVLPIESFEPFAHRFTAKNSFPAGSFQEGSEPSGDAELSDRTLLLVGRPPSQLATHDFLGLRSLIQGATGSDQIQPRTYQESEERLISDRFESTPRGNEWIQSPMSSSPVVARVEAPVVMSGGSGAGMLLSHEAISKLAQQVNLLGLAKKDGEIKIRLKPDHLGELSMSVKNQGDQISVRILAQHDDAKQIIESSLSQLRDSLQLQHLHLAKIEVTQMPTSHLPSDPTLQLDLGQFNRGHSDWNDQQQRQDRTFDAGMELDSSNARSRSSKNDLNTASRWIRTRSEGLDLIA